MGFQRADARITALNSENNNDFYKNGLIKYQCTIIMIWQVSNMPNTKGGTRVPPVV
jgi:hypothetical protein